MLEFENFFCFDLLLFANILPRCNCCCWFWAVLGPFDSFFLHLWHSCWAAAAVRPVGIAPVGDCGSDPLSVVGSGVLWCPVAPGALVRVGDGQTTPGAQVHIRFGLSVVSFLEK